MVSARTHQLALAQTSARLHDRQNRQRGPSAQQPCDTTGPGAPPLPDINPPRNQRSSTADGSSPRGISLSATHPARAAEGAAAAAAMPVAATELADPARAGADGRCGAELNGKGHAKANGACANGKAHHHREALGDVLWEDVPEVGFAARRADDASCHAPVSASLDCADRRRAAARRVAPGRSRAGGPRRPSRTRS
jgi:hypothetical protein